MDWIKAIIEKHKGAEGDFNLETAMDEIKKEFPKNAVPKEVYNQSADDLKAANKLVTDLKKSNKDAEELQTKINDYEAQVKKLEAERVDERKTFTLKEALKEAGANDVDYMIYKLGDVEVDKEGNVIELENKIKSLKESNPSHFEVNDAATQTNDKGSDKKTNGYQVLDNGLENGKQTETQPVSLADAIKSQYENN